MSKKKDSLALLEVIQRTREKRHSPSPDVPAQAAVPQEQPVPESPTPASLESILPRPAGIANGRFSEPKTHFISRQGGRLMFSLGAVSGTGAAAALLVAIALAFLAGRWTMREASQKPAVQPPAAGVRQGRQAPSGPPAPQAQAAPAGPASQTGRQSGKYYLVIQNLGVGADSSSRLTAEGAALKSQADDIVKFLKGHHKGATVNTYKGKYVIVWSLDGFDSSNSPQAKNFATEIETLGNAYLARGGRWNFKQRNRAGQLDAMFLPQP